MPKLVAVAIIRTDQSIEITHQNANLEFLQAQVKGYIEAVSFWEKPDGQDDWQPAVMYVNEEGKLTGLPVNVIATELFRKLKGFYDVIMGDVVICGSHEAENADLPDWMFKEITAAVDAARSAMQ